MGQNFRLFHLLKISVLNFRIFLPVYPVSVTRTDRGARWRNECIETCLGSAAGSARRRAQDPTGVAPGSDRSSPPGRLEPACLPGLTPRNTPLPTPSGHCRTPPSSGHASATPLWALPNLEAEGRLPSTRPPPPPPPPPPPTSDWVTRAACR